MLRDRFYKKKIVGGKLGGNLFDTVKSLFSIGSKFLVSKLPAIAKSFAIGAANAAGNKLATKMLNPHTAVNETKAVISNIRPIPQSQVLTDDSRALLSNLIAGNGLKKKRGRGMARII